MTAVRLCVRRKRAVREYTHTRTEPTLFYVVRFTPRAVWHRAQRLICGTEQSRTENRKLRELRFDAVRRWRVGDFLPSPLIPLSSKRRLSPSLSFPMTHTSLLSTTSHACDRRHAARLLLLLRRPEGADNFSRCYPRGKRERSIRRGCLSAVAPSATDVSSPSFGNGD